MKKFLSFATVAFAALAFQGCSSSTTPNPTPTPSSTIAFTANGSYTYNQDKIDTATTTTPEHRDSATRDVITSTVITTDLKSFAGRANGVVEIENSHSVDGTKDTTYMYQESGNVYRYNYGLEGLIRSINSFLGATISPGWVLQAKMTATAGATWVGIDTVVSVPYMSLNVPVRLVDNVTEANDTTIVVNGKSMIAKHSIHSVTANMVIANPVLLAAISIDNYVTTDAGTVINITHSFHLTVPNTAPVAYPGQYTVLTSFK